jgi:hypothetical protein
MKLGKGKDGLIEYNVLRNIDTACGDVETLVPFMKVDVPKEGATNRLKLKLL